MNQMTSIDGDDGDQGWDMISPLVHLIDDDESLRRAVARVLEAAGYEVRCYSSCGEFLLAQPFKQPGCLVLDVRMPGPSGLELQEALKKQGNTIPIVFLTGHGDISTSVRAMKAGAVDFLTKPVERDALLSAVETALKKDQTERTERERAQALHSRFQMLTQRERSVLELVAQGKLNKQIAASLGIAERTVKAHRAQVMEKLQVESFAELIMAANILCFKPN